ncbi:MFS polyamine transporter [Trametopsis cervina]|nr:MFS polyamine transporter [Trametopsis cervina]
MPTATPSPSVDRTPTATLRGDDPVDVPLNEKTSADPNPEARLDSGEGNGRNTPSRRRQSDATVEETSEQEGVLLVDWEGPNDPENPKNWTFKRKWAATAIISAFTFISPVSSSMVAPAASQVAGDFGITSEVIIALTTSVFVLAYAFGPLFLGPLSEIYGRSRVLQVANLWYLVWNLVCGFAKSEGQLIAFRLLAGFGGSAPLSIGGGVLGDCWRPDERGKAVALYSLAPLLGPVVGPVAGAWIAEKSTWRWVFWSTSIVDGGIQILGMFFLQETFAPVLLERKAERMRKQLASDVADPEKKQGHREIRTVFDTADRHWQTIFSKALTRPFKLFFSEPIIQLLGVYMAFVYGILYLFLTTMPSIFEGVYQQRVGIAGLHYLALGVGLSVASQVNARYMDRIYRHFAKRNGGVGMPEYRLPSMIPGTVCLPIGLFITGWTARADIHWIVPDIGIALVGAGVILLFQSIQTYVIDAFTLHAASALAAVTFFRSCAGFGFPLFAPTMYNALGYGKGDSILAAVAIVIGCPAPFIFWKYGERIRKASKYARS